MIYNFKTIFGYCKNMHTFKKFTNAYNEEERDIVLKMYNEGKYPNYTEQDWQNFYQRCKGNQNLLIALCLHPAVHPKIVQQVMLNKPYKKVCLAILFHKNDSQFTDITIRECLNNLSDKNIMDIIDKLPSEEDKGNPFNQKVTEYLANRLYTTVHLDYEVKPYDYIVAHYMKNKSCASIIIEKDLSELLNTNIADNPNLPDNVRNRAFEKDVDYMGIHNMTPKMAKSMYETVIDVLTEKEGASGVIYNPSISLSSTILYRLIINNALTPAQEMDLAHRYIEMNPAKSQPMEFIKFLLTTKNVEAMWLVANADMKQRVFTRMMLSNPNIPKPLYDKIMETRARQFVDGEYTKDEDVLCITESIRRNEMFSEKTYDILLEPMKNKDKKKIEEMVTIYDMIIVGNKTSSYALNKIIEYTDNERFKLYATLAKKMKERNFKDCEKITVLQMLYNGIMVAQGDAKDYNPDKIMRFLKEQKTTTEYTAKQKNEIQEIIEGVDLLCKSYTKDCIDDLYRELNETKMNYQFEFYLTENRFQYQLDRYKEQLKEKEEISWMDDLEV